MNAFIFDPHNLHVYVKDGVVGFSCLTDEYKEGIRFLRKLYEEQLLDNECFVMDMDMLRSKCLSGDISIVGSAPCMHYLGLFGVDGTRPYEYDSLPPIEGPNGYKSSYWDPYGLDKGKFAITTKAENPEILARWIDAFYDEAGLLGQKYGIENEQWYHPAADSGERGHGEGLGERAARFNWMPGVTWSETLQNVTLNQQGPIYETRDFRGSWTIDPASPLEPNLIEDTLPYEGTQQEEFYTNLIPLTLEENDEIAVLTELLNRYVDEMVAAFVSGQRDIDAEWDSYIQTLKDMGVERYVEIRQAAYDRFKAASSLEKIQ